MKIFYPGVFEVAEVAEVKQPRNSKRRKFSNENLWKLDEIQNLVSATSKMTSWWPLDLNDLGNGLVNFFKNYISKISASSWGKRAIARISSPTFKIQNFVYFMAASEDRELKTGICKSLNRKPSNSSFFSAWCTDFKNVIFEKIHWATSEVIEVKRSSRGHFRGRWGQILDFI